MMKSKSHKAASSGLSKDHLKRSKSRKSVRPSGKSWKRDQRSSKLRIRIAIQRALKK